MKTQPLDFTESTKPSLERERAPLHKRLHRRPERRRHASGGRASSPLPAGRRADRVRWGCRQKGTQSREGSGGRGGATGLDLSFLETSLLPFHLVSPGAGAGAGGRGGVGRRLLSNETVKAQVSHQAHNKHACVVCLLSLLNGSSLHINGLAAPAPIAPPVSTTMPPHNYLTLMNLIFNFPAWPWYPGSPNKGSGAV